MRGNQDILRALLSKAESRDPEPVEVGSLPLIPEEVSRDPFALASAFMDLDANVAIKDPPTHLRASSIIDCCIRQKALQNIYQVSSTAYTDFSLRLIYGLGNAVHKSLQNDAGFFGNRRLGQWVCKCPQDLPTGNTLSRYPGRCPDCNTEPRYWEVELKYDSPPLSGHPDMFLDCGDAVRLAEFKTINGSDFQSLRRPLEAHVHQMQAYFMLIRMTQTEAEYDYGYIFYVDKSGGAFPIKAFRVDAVSALQDQIGVRLMSFRNAIRSKGSVLPRVHAQCSRSNFSRYPAQGCPVIDICRRSANTPSSHPGE